MRHFDLSPLYRSTVGFDRLFSMLDQVAGGDEDVVRVPGPQLCHGGGKVFGTPCLHIDRLRRIAREAGVDLRTIQILMGHASIISTTRYLHLTRKTLDAAPSLLDLLKLPPAPPSWRRPPRMVAGVESIDHAGDRKSVV